MIRRTLCLVDCNASPADGPNQSSSPFGLSLAPRPPSRSLFQRIHPPKLPNPIETTLQLTLPDPSPHAKDLPSGIMLYPVPLPGLFRRGPGEDSRVRLGRAESTFRGWLLGRHRLLLGGSWFVESVAATISIGRSYTYSYSVFVDVDCVDVYRARVEQWI